VFVVLIGYNAVFHLTLTAFKISRKTTGTSQLENKVLGENHGQIS